MTTPSSGCLPSDPTHRALPDWVGVADYKYALHPFPCNESALEQHVKPDTQRLGEKRS